MTIKEQLNIDLKKAMLAGDKTLATTLRGLKSVILYAEVSTGSREAGLDNEEVILLLQKESKKRQESAELFEKGGNTVKQQEELAEKEVIDAYLPPLVGEAELIAEIEHIIQGTGANGAQDMGKVIGAVKQKFGASAEGSVVAKLVRERLMQ